MTEGSIEQSYEQDRRAPRFGRPDQERHLPQMAMKSPRGQPKKVAQLPPVQSQQPQSNINQRIENSLRRIDDKFQKLNNNLQQYQDIMQPA